jgi:hypothetical protein
MTLSSFGNEMDLKALPEKARSDINAIRDLDSKCTEQTEEQANEDSSIVSTLRGTKRVSTGEVTFERVVSSTELPF